MHKLYFKASYYCIVFIIYTSKHKNLFVTLLLYGFVWMWLLHIFAPVYIYFIRTICKQYISHIVDIENGREKLHRKKRSVWAQRRRLSRVQVRNRFLLSFFSRRKTRVLPLCILFFLHARIWFLLIGVIARRKPVVSAQRAAVMSVVMANICHVLSPTRILSVEN